MTCPLCDKAIYNDESTVTSHSKCSANMKAERDQLRAALVGLVGVDGCDELGQMEAMMRLLPAPAADKAVTIDAIHALLATVLAQ